MDEVFDRFGRQARALVEAGDGESFRQLLELCERVEAYGAELPLPDESADESCFDEYYMRQHYCFHARNMIWDAIMAGGPRKREEVTMSRLTAEQIENILARGEFAADDVGMTRGEAEAERERQIEKRISKLEVSHPYFGDPTWPSPIENLISKAMFYVLNDHPNKDFELRLMAPFTEWEHPRDPRCESVQLITMFVEELVALLPPEALERIEKRRHRSLMGRCRNFPQHDGYLAPHLSEIDRKRMLAKSAGLKGVKPKTQICPACRAAKIASASDCAGSHKSREPVPSENS